MKLCIIRNSGLLRTGSIAPPCKEITYRIFTNRTTWYYGIVMTVIARGRAIYLMNSEQRQVADDPQVKPVDRVHP